MCICRVLNDTLHVTGNNCLFCVIRDSRQPKHAAYVKYKKTVS